MIRKIKYCKCKISKPSKSQWCRHICEKCKGIIKPIKTRRSWQRKPVTQIQRDKTKYDRNREKRKIRRNIEE